jgi:hypothetical protein
MPRYEIYCGGKKLECDSEVRGANDVAVIDMEKLTLARRIKAGTEPQGL